MQILIEFILTSENVAAVRNPYHSAISAPRERIQHALFRNHAQTNVLLRLERPPTAPREGACGASGGGRGRAEPQTARHVLASAVGIRAGIARAAKARQWWQQ